MSLIFLIPAPQRENAYQKQYVHSHRGRWEQDDKMKIVIDFWCAIAHPTRTIRPLSTHYPLPTTLSTQRAHP